MKLYGRIFRSPEDPRFYPGQWQKYPVYVPRIQQSKSQPVLAHMRFAAPGGGSGHSIAWIPAHGPLLGRFQMPRAEMLSQPLRSLCDCNKFIVRIAAVSKLFSLRGSAVKGISPPPQPENFVFRGKPLHDCKVYKCMPYLCRYSGSVMACRRGGNTCGHPIFRLAVICFLCRNSGSVRVRR